MKDLAHENDAMEWIGSTFRSLLSTEDCGGRQNLMEVISEPMSGPPRHIHEHEDETFYVLSGALEFWVAGERMIKHAGEAAFVPRGTEHTFRVVSDQPARFLTLHTPGGFDAFIAEMVTNNYLIPQNMDEVAKAAGRYNTTFTGPPLTD